MTRVIPLKHLARINERALPATTDPDREIRYVEIGSVGRGELVRQPERMRFADAPSRARRLVREGDTIISTVRTYLRAVWPVSGDAGDLVVSTGFAVLTPTEVDPSYFSWWVLSDAFVEEVVARSVGVSYPAINASELGDLGVWVPSLAEQRAIADYLDTETNRIDTLITKKRRMIELLEERRSGAVEAHIRDLAARYGESPLKFHTPKILVGIVITPAAFYADQGIPALRGINVKPGFLDLTDLVCLSEEAHTLHQKSRLFRDDIVVVRTGQAGAACVVPRDMDGANCVDLLIVRRSTDLDPHYLEYVINSDWTIKHIEKHSVGSIQSHFNVESLRQLPVPVPPLEVQAKTTATLDRIVGNLNTATRKLDSQIKLLAERRRALITATVTGEFAVAAASG